MMRQKGKEQRMEPAVSVNNGSVNITLSNLSLAHAHTHKQAPKQGNATSVTFE